MKKLSIYIVLFATLVAGGCGTQVWSDTKDATSKSYDYMFDTTPTTRSYHEVEEIPLIKLNHRAADELASNISWNELKRESPIYFTKFVNANNPADTAIFGSVITNQVVGGLVQNKIKMTLGEPKPINAMPNGGAELPHMADVSLLADNATAAAPKLQKKRKESMVRNAPPESVPDARLTGNYVIGDTFIYMHATIVRLIDDAVVSGHNWVIPISDNVRELLPQLQHQEGLTPTVRTSF